VKIKFRKINRFVCFVLLLLLIIYMDLINIVRPNWYLQRYAGYSHDFLSYYKVKIALVLGAEPNNKIGDTEEGETPFFVSYFLGNAKVALLMLPQMNCSNLRRAESADRRAGYQMIKAELEFRCG
jgi:hypothetical protein